MEFIEAREGHFKEIACLASSPEELYLVYPSGKYPWDTAQLRALASSRTDLTVAITDGRIVAFANLYKIEVGASAFIGNVVVASAHRGNGFGKALTSHMVNLCVSKYRATPRLSVFNFNTVALLMYASMGFRPYAVEPRQDLQGKKVALIHMQFEAEK